jgi:hypothetical protein
VALGDVNDFEFSTALTTLNGGVLHNMTVTLPQAERYSFVFEGNSEALDHVLVSNSLFSSRPLTYDILHVNSEFAEQVVSHDPAVLRIQTAVKLLTALSPAHLFVTLKNSDDIGTSFDLKVEARLNGSLVASGLARCITGVPRSPASAKEVTVPFGTVSPVTVIPGDTLSLKVLTRIGTNPDDTKCPGHWSAVGLRLYYDAVSRSSRFDATISTLSEDLFLHSNGGACLNAPSVGATTFSLNTTAPSSTQPKCQDSGAVSFASGNPFKTIGTWSMTLP